MEHLVTSSPVAAVIGAGAIAPFHIAALRAAGFEVSHIAARAGSKRATDLASKHGVQQVWPSAAELIASDAWDAIVLASSTESIPELLRLVLRQQRPCLVEKPVGFTAAAIAEFVGNDDQVRVAYNRRFYSATTAASEFAATGRCIFRLELPDSIEPAASEMTGLRAVRENSVHGLDLLRHILGRYKVEARFDISEPRGRLAVVTTEAGHVGTIVLNWNCPANFSLVLDRSPRRFELKPFELGSTFEGMEVIEPSDDMPVRRYVPKLVHQVSSFPGPDGVKPGFLQQAQSLMSAVQRGEWDSRSATLDDAAFAADVARVLTSD